MAHNAYLVQRGNRVAYSNSGSAIPTKNVVVIRSGTSGMIGITESSIAATTGTGVLAIGGGDERIWNLPKHSGESFAFGDVLYWSTGSEYLTKTSSGNTRAGVCAKAAGSAATTADFVLNG
jgi:predicted RecA/RadA family phage recombinase